MINLSNSTAKDLTAEGDAFCQRVEHNTQVIGNLYSSVHSEYEALQQELVAAERSCKEEVSTLQQCIQAMQEEREALQGDQSKTQQQLTTLTDRLKQVHKLLADKEGERAAEQQQLSSVQQEVSSKQAVLDDIVARNKERDETVGRGLGLFQQHLGLDISRATSSNTTIFAFTQIKRCEPERVFSVAITLSDRMYVLATEPPLPDLQHLQERLNLNNNLAGFLVLARKLFKKMD